MTHLTTKPVNDLLQQAVDSLVQPMKFFEDHGVLLLATNWSMDHRFTIPDITVRRIARHLVQAMKRPFILATTYQTMYDYRRVAGSIQSIKLDAPAFYSGQIKIPRRKYLEAYLPPLALLENSPDVGTNLHMNSGLWTATMKSEQLWTEYLSNMLHDPELRAARRAPPLHAAHTPIPEYLRR